MYFGTKDSETLKISFKKWGEYEVQKRKMRLTLQCTVVNSPANPEVIIRLNPVDPGTKRPQKSGRIIGGGGWGMGDGGWGWMVYGVPWGYSL